MEERSVTGAQRPTLAERRRIATTREIEIAAVELCGRSGYEAVTVEQIAAQAGISLRTFYRYFTSKQDVITGRLAAGGIDLAAGIADRSELPVHDAAREALIAAIDGSDYDHAYHRRAIALCTSTPALRGSWLNANRVAQDRLAPVVARRFPHLTRRAALAYAGAVTAALTIALEAWALEPDHELSALADECLAAFAPAG